MEEIFYLRLITMTSAFREDCNDNHRSRDPVCVRNFAIRFDDWSLAYRFSSTILYLFPMMNACLTNTIIIAIAVDDRHDFNKVKRVQDQKYEKMLREPI